MPLSTLTAYVTCTLCRTDVPADDVESAPAGCDVTGCGDCMTEHVRACGACAVEVIDCGDF